MLSSLSVVAFAVSAAAVWRLTHLLVYEAGPAGLLDRLRTLPWLAPALGCFHCCSLWTALALAPWLGDGWVEIAVLWLALSGAAIVIERVSAPATPPAPLWHEAPAPAAAPAVSADPAAAERPRPSKEEEPHVLLRS
jgi:hypothetical protein